SPQQLEVKDVQVLIETADGKTLTGESVSDVDAVRVMEFYKAIGPKYNATLVRKNKLPPGQTADRMIAAQFGASEQEVQRRRSLRLVVRDLDGATFNLVEKR
ncbi:MAG TPA: hypothetical protein VEQ63_09220, partial [Bryobacteraceae bacterium]|nr:hypothetical protein [Bryobacteraceae bacterium]